MNAFWRPQAARMILERGSHRELMTNPDSAYRRFVDLQTRGVA